MEYFFRKEQMGFSYNGIKITIAGAEIDFVPAFDFPQNDHYHHWVYKDRTFGSMRHIEFRETDIHLWFVQYNIKKDISLKFHVPDLRSLSLFYSLGDDIDFNINNIGEGTARSNFFNMVYLPSVEIDVHLKRNTTISLFGINFSPEKLTRLGTPEIVTPLLESVIERKAKLLTIGQDAFPIVKRMRIIIDQFVHSMETGEISTKYPLVYEFIMLIYQSFEITGLYGRNEKQRDFSLMKAVIEDDIRTITAREIMAKFEYSKGALRALFIEQTGLNATDYIRKVKMDRAMELVEGSSMQIKSIAKALGYGDTASFSNAFSAFHAISPKDVRQSVKSSK